MPNNILITPGSASIQFSGSANNDTIRLQVEPSGSVAFYGNSGSLFSITDQLSGSLMSVNDISGLPILEVFSDDRVVMGTFNQNTLVVTGSLVGIRKASPSAELDISGSTFITGSLRVTGSQTLNGILRVVSGAISSSGPNSGIYLDSISTNPNLTILADPSHIRYYARNGSHMFRVGNVDALDIAAFSVAPVSDNQATIGTSGVRWGTGFINNIRSSGSITNTGSLNILSGSINITNGGITSSLFGTSSWANNSISASFTTTASAATSITFIPPTASFATTSSFAVSASWAPSAGGGITQLIAGDGLTGGTITSTGTITVDTGSVHFLDGVKKELNTEGVISSSLQINTGSFSGSFIGTLLGTSSWATNAVTASFFSGSVTFPSGLIVTGSILATTVSASSFIGPLTGTASFATTASFAISSSRSVTSSFATTASAATALTFTPATASYSLTSSVSISSSFATSASWAPGVVMQVTGSTIFSNTLTNNVPTFDSVIIGTGSGFNAVDHKSVVFIGPNAGRNSAANIGGFTDANVFIGTSAGENFGRGGNNVFIGNAAGSSATNVFNVIAIGESAGQLNSGSDNSILIGFSAGFGSVIRQNNIIIGSNITLASGQASAINIGGVIFGTGSVGNTGANPAPNSRVGIGTFNPVATLQVQGNISASSYTSSISNAVGFFGTSSWATTASFAISSSRSITSSFAISASWAPSAGGITQLIAGDGLTGGTITSTGTITVATGSVHFLDGVKKELNTEGVISGSTFSSPSQGTVRAIINGIQTDVDTGLQTGDSPQFTNLNVSSTITASIASASVITGSHVQLINVVDTTSTNKVLVLDTATNKIFTTASVGGGGGSGNGFPYNGTVIPAVISGSLLISSSINSPLTISGSVNDFFEVEVVNASAGNNASADFVVSSNNTTDFGNFAAFGINSTTFNGPLVGGPSDAYLYVTSSVGELDIGHAHAGANSNIRLFTNGPNSTANTRVFISASGNVGIGTTTNLRNTLTVNGSVSASSMTGSFTGSFSGSLDRFNPVALRITVGTTAPSSPAINDLWVDTN